MAPKYSLAIIAGQLVVGGAERQLYLWLSHLDREKFQPVVLTLHPGHGDYWEKPIESLGIPLLRIPHHRIPLVRAMEIVRTLRPHRPDIIHGWHLFASPYAGLAAKLLGTHSLGGVRGNLQGFYDARPEANLSLWLVDGMMANSDSMAAQLQILKKRSLQRIYTVQNAVEDPINDRSAIRDCLSKRYGFSPSNAWLGSLGRLDRGKRFDLLLHVLKLLRQDRIDFQFLLIGDGPERSRLESMTNELGIRSHVVFAGEIPDASALLSALDVFCFTSLDEGLPNAVMEAAAAGVPIVSWRAPFMEELLKNGDVALLVEPERIGDFKKAVVDLICSQELRSHLGRAARDHVRAQFSLSRFVENMTNVYESLLDSRQARFRES